MSAEKIKAQEARDLYILKQKAMQYYEENQVPSKMEEILNKTFYEAPNDVFGHIANYFEQFMVTPTVTKVMGREVLDSAGQACLQAEVYVTVKNHQQLLSTTTASSEPCSTDVYALKPDERQVHDEESQKRMTDALNMLKHSFNGVLVGLDPSQQKQADMAITEVIEKLRQEEEDKKAKLKEENETQEIMSPKPESVSPSKGKKSPKGGKGGGKGGKEVVVVADEEAETSVCGCEALSVASQAVCEAAAHVKHLPLYHHIAMLKFGQLPSSLKLPLPVATILSSGKHMPGKQNYVTEFMVVPKPDMPYNQAFKYISKIYHHCAHSVSAKTGAVSRLVNDVGALCPVYDRPEQGVDLLQEAITALGLVPGTDFHIILNLAGPDIFDYEKGKYEVTVGAQKGAEDLADYWGDILNRYPSVIALIDPMRGVEREAWMKLCERVTEHCHVLGDVTHHRAGLLAAEQTTPEWRTSGAVLSMRGQNTVTDLINVSNNMDEEGCEVMIGTAQGTSTSTFPVDLAVGLQARFIKLGAPVRGERVALYNYLLQVEEQLGGEGMLGTWSPHVFTLIKPPTPPPPPEEDEDAATKDKKN